MPDDHAVVPSPSESSRFARSIGRLSLDGPFDPAALDDALEQIARSAHDLVILRYPASWVAAFERVAAVPGRRALFADLLLYFEWRDDGRPLDASQPVATGERVDLDAVPAVVEEIFADYMNHYAANSALDSRLVAVGYAEWAQGVAVDPDNIVVVEQSPAGVRGLAVIDARSGVWDVVLAGVRPAHRGGGVYGRLMTDVMSHARACGQPSVRISTQSHNVQVMRTWERLGWRLASATVTVHCERA